ncbi:esterase-like activity of phytase family protein [Microcoleus sp. FACHB-61]|uniref:esterase-like activity of phytase family protein n=1 Tax=Microcoleus vaginatus TaxID=119532 RepID=UPI00168917B5|nr:esterase-like activity of phytase family protein [Microcoleus sp. FACHB-61]
MAAINGTSGNDTLSGTIAADLIYGLGGDDAISGQQGNNRLFGSSGNDFLLGGAGNDALYGGRNQDTLQGGEGDDFLYGDLDRDILTGGGGKNIFAIGRIGTRTTGGSQLENADLITDFVKGQDLISLSGISPANIEISQGTGNFSNSIVLRDTATNEFLAILEGVNSFDAGDFTVAQNPVPGVRFSSFNASLNRSNAGRLITDLSTPNNQQAKNVAETIQRVNPDVLLINEFDYDSSSTALNLFQQNYLSVSQNGASPVNYPFRYTAPSNTGIASGLDLDNNGSVVTQIGTNGYGNDAFGFGDFPGQYGMAVYSKYPIDTANIRTFQNFLWKDMPGALLPDDPSTPAANDYYSPAELNVFRLSSKSHWDVPININGEIVHALVSHPTPPVFDGPEDRNGKRNHDEIRFWADYVTPGRGSYIYDDRRTVGGLAPNASFVIMGDQNADPFDGDSFDKAILQLLNNSRVNTGVTSVIPASLGGIQQVADGGNNVNQKGNAAFDTADFGDAGNNPGNLRVDYVLPSADLPINDAGVFWPLTTDPLYRLVGDRQTADNTPTSDHSLVWADIAVGDRSPRTSVRNINFIGQATYPTGSVTVEGTQVGGLSGIDYDQINNRYYSISDDRSDRNPARFYTLNIDLSSGSLSSSGINFSDVTTLLNQNNQPFATNTIDPEGIGLTSNGTVFISSEGEVSTLAGRLQSPFVNEFALGTGRQLRELPVPSKFVPVIGPADAPTAGIRNNLAFENLTITPDGKFLFTANENALVQDGPIATTNTGSRSRILKYNLTTGQPEQEFLYLTDPVAVPAVPETGFNTNGLVELLALDNRGTFLALERSFSAGAPGTGNTIKLYEVRLNGASDISGINSLNAININTVRPVEKRLVLNFDTLGLPTGLDNVEGMTLGPVLPNGQQSLVLVSDNNFSATQFTQILAFGLALENETPRRSQSLDILTDGGLSSAAVSGDDNIDSALITDFRTVSGLMGFDTEHNSAIGSTAINLPGVGALRQPGSQIAAEQNVSSSLPSALGMGLF